MIKGQKVGNLYKVIENMVKVKLGHSNSQVDRDYSCAYASSERNELHEQVELIIMGQIKYLWSLNDVARSIRTNFGTGVLVNCYEVDFMLIWKYSDHAFHEGED